MAAPRWSQVATGQPGASERPEGGAALAAANGSAPAPPPAEPEPISLLVTRIDSGGPGGGSFLSPGPGGGAGDAGGGPSLGPSEGLPASLRGGGFNWKGA